MSRSKREGRVYRMNRVFAFVLAFTILGASVILTGNNDDNTSESDGDVDCSIGSDHGQKPVGTGDGDEKTSCRGNKGFFERSIHNTLDRDKLGSLNTMPVSTDEQYDPLTMTRNSDYVTHVITHSELNSLRRTIGVRDPETNYNVLYGGHGTGLAPPAEEDWAAMADMEVVTGAYAGDLPSSVDHSGSAYFPVVGNQGQQGSCTCWATAYYANGYLQAKDNVWTGASSGVKSQLMSPGWVYNKINPGYDSGSWNVVAIRHIQNVGNSRMSTMDYNDADFISWGNETAWRDAPEYKVGDYQFTYSTNIDVLKSWLYDGYPILFSINSDSFNDLGTGDDTIDSSEYSYSNTDHAQCIVGYSDAKSAGGDIGAFKVVNSWGSDWGTSWGGNGYYWITYKALAEIPYGCFRFFDKPEYEPTMLATWNFTGGVSRDCDIQLGTGSSSNPDDIRTPYWDGGYHNYPQFMALDISEFRGEAGLNNFFLKVSAGINSSSISSFRLEAYDNGYSINGSSFKSTESLDVPKSTPCAVNNDLFGFHMDFSSPDRLDYVPAQFGASGSADPYCTEVVLHEDFECDMVANGWDAWDWNSSYGEDHWNTSTARAWNGEYSAYCAGDQDPVYFQSFNNSGWMPSDWTTYSEGTGADAEPWFMENYGYDYVYGGDDYGAVCDSDAAGAGTTIDEWLYMTAPFDASDYSSLGLEFFLDFYEGSGDDYVQVLYSYNGVNFNTIVNYNSGTTGWKDVDISTVAGQSAVYLAFFYHATYDWYVFVDDVKVHNEVSDQYDRGMDSIMLYPVSLSAYSYVNLSFDYWVDMHSTNDYFGALYWVNGQWDGAFGTNTQGWAGGWMPVPTGATYIAFYFFSSGNTQYEGVYIDNITLTGYYNITRVDVKVKTGSFVKATGTTSWSVSLNAGAYSNGMILLTSRATYGPGKYAYDYNVVILDKTPPVAFTPLVDPTGWSADTSPTITFSTTDSNSGMSHYQLCVDGGTFANDTSPCILSPLSDGQHTVTVRAWDVAGNYRDGSVDVYVDTGPPTGLEPVADPEGWSSDPVLVSFSASDAVSAVDRFELSIDGGSFTVGSSPYTVPLSVGDGTHEVKVRAYDKADNYLEGSVDVYIDDTPPDDFDPVADPDGWTARTVQVTFSTTDATSGIDRYELCIDGGTFSEATSPHIIPALPDGVHTVTVRAYDLAGNVAESETEVMVDITPPASFTPVAEPDTWTPSEPVITFSTNDGASGVDHYEVSVDGGAFSEATSPYTVPSILQDGTHTITVAAVDAAGNTRESSVDVYLDSTPPDDFSPELVDGTTGWISDANPEVEFSTDDDVSGLDRFEVKVDSGEYIKRSSPARLPTLADGEHEVTIRAYDLAGNFRDGLLTVMTDVTDPLVEIKSPERAEEFEAGVVEIRWDASDETSGILATTLILDGEEETDVSDETSLEVTLDTGRHTVTVVVTDLAGNSEDDEVTFDVVEAEGDDGGDGTDGDDGADGTDGSDGQDGTDGEDGTDGIDGADGTDGADGEDGNDGTDGDGSSSSEDVSSSGDDDSLMYIMVALLVVLVLISIIILALVMKRRGSAPQQQPRRGEYPTETDQSEHYRAPPAKGSRSGGGYGIADSGGYGIADGGGRGPRKEGAPGGGVVAHDESSNARRGENTEGGQSSPAGKNRIVAGRKSADTSDLLPPPKNLDGSAKMGVSGHRGRFKTPSEDGKSTGKGVSEDPELDDIFGGL